MYRAELTDSQITNLKIWIAALRSGEYTQCKFGLKRRLQGQDRFCVWGVACDVLRDKIRGNFVWERQGIPVIIEHDFEYLFVDTSNGKTFDTVPDREIEAAVGFKTEDTYSSLVIWGRDASPCGLMRLNDDCNLSFPQLADVIEAWMNGWDLTVGGLY